MDYRQAFLPHCARKPATDGELGDMRGTSRGARRRELLFLVLGLLILTCGLGWWSARARRAGVRSPADQALLDILTLTTLPAGNLRNQLTPPPAMPADPLTPVGTARLRELEEENTQLRALLGLREVVKSPPLAAQILARGLTPWQGFLQAGAGSAEGVQAQMVALTPVGVLGQVNTVGEHTADIIPLTDSASGIGAKVVREVMVTPPPPPAIANVTPAPASVPAATVPSQRTLAVGVLKGYQEGACQPGECYLAYIADQADVKVGDRVVTSGLGHIFGHITPAGFPLGEVTAVTRNASLASLDIVVKPAADPATVQWVALVK